MDGEPFSWERSMVARLCSGDDLALGALYDQFAPLVYGIALRLTGSSEAADICQEVFLSLWEHPERYDPERGSLRTFLAVVARRRCIDHLRASGRRVTRDTKAAGPAANLTRTPPSVEESAAAMIAAEKVRAALQRLPVEQREAVELAYLQGLTYRQVAASLGIPEGTAKSRLRLALTRLARELAGWDPSVEEREWA